MDATATDPAAPEPLALRGFKTFLAAALGTAAIAAVGAGAGYLVGRQPDALPLAATAFVMAVHLGHERLLGILSGRGRFGVRDAFARQISKDVAAVARQEPGGAWVVLTDNARSVLVFGRKGFEQFAGVRARKGDVVKVLREDGDRYVVDRYEGGVHRDSDKSGGGWATEVYDRSGEMIGTRTVKAPIPAPEALGPRIEVTDDGRLSLVPWRGATVVPSASLTLPPFVKDGSELHDAIKGALENGPVHVRRGNTWLAFSSDMADPAVVPERAYQRSRRSCRDHVEVRQAGDGIELTRLTFGRLDSAAHGEPARVTYHADGTRTDAEWFVEGRPADEEAVREAAAAYRSEPMAGLA